MSVYVLTLNLHKIHIYSLLEQNTHFIYLSSYDMGVCCMAMAIEEKLNYMLHVTVH